MRDDNPFRDSASPLHMPEEHVPLPDTVYCWHNMHRVCGEDCMAFDIERAGEEDNPCCQILSKGNEVLRLLKRIAKEEPCSDS